MSKIQEIAQAIERLPANEFQTLAAWIEQRRASASENSVDRKPEACILTRNHSAFLNSYCPEDEGLYDDVAAR